MPAAARRIARTLPPARGERRTSERRRDRPYVPNTARKVLAPTTGMVARGDTSARSRSIASQQRKIAHLA